MTDETTNAPTDPGTDTDRLGTLHETDSGWELRYTRTLGRPPEAVWRAFAEPDLVAKWFPSSIRGDLRAGEPLTFEIKDHDAETFDGTVVEAEEPHVLALRWGTDLLRFELAEIDGGTELTMTITLAEYGRAARDAAGWHECLDQLAELWAGEAGPARAATWAEVHPRYVERFGADAATVGPPQAYLDAHGS